MSIKVVYYVKRTGTVAGLCVTGGAEDRIAFTRYVKIKMLTHLIPFPVADLHSKILDARPLGPILFTFMRSK